MQDRTQEGKESTIYQYQLIRRIRHSLFFTGLYPALLVTYIFYSILTHGWNNIIWLGISAGSVLLVHSIGIYLLCWRNGERLRGCWKFQFQLPRFGWVPATSYTRLDRFRHMFVQLFWLGLFLFAALSPWAAHHAAMHGVVLHLWVLLPQLTLLLRCLRQPGSYLIRFGIRETSIYKQ
ncbi:hypothetical protein [Paenibacillus gansuensis]|uniref:Transposase n=1 Tax=Paenibacillus gansuensis TaxID=306542 RepID=A0ABW5PAN5_9BACL